MKLGSKTKHNTFNVQFTYQWKLLSMTDSELFGNSRQYRPNSFRTIKILLYVNSQVLQSNLQHHSLQFKARTGKILR